MLGLARRREAMALEEVEAVSSIHDMDSPLLEWSMLKIPLPLSPLQQ